MEHEPLDLAGIQDRYELANDMLPARTGETTQEWRERVDLELASRAFESSNDVPALIAEIRRLQELLHPVNVPAAAAEPFTFTVDARAEHWYRGLKRLDPRRVESALSDAKSRVKEWVYEGDEHTYCHDRTDWIALVAEIERLRAEVSHQPALMQMYGREVIEDPDDGPEGYIDVKGRLGSERWILTCSEHGNLGDWPVVPYTDKTEAELAWDQHLIDQHLTPADRR